MAPKTKIVVFKAKELMYTGIFIFLGILLILLLVSMFSPSKKKKQATETMTYTKETYSAPMTLGENEIEVIVSVKKDKIQSIALKHLNKSIKTMYPLVEPTVEQINKELPKVDSIDDIQLKDENQYTKTMIIQAVKKALKAGDD